MNVYFGENFWGKGEPGTQMEEIRVGQGFQWEELSGSIPAIYVSGEGLVIDLCIRIPHKTVQDFWDRWHKKLEEGLDEREQEQLMSEDPLDVDFDLKVSVNGQRLENRSGCGAGYTRVFGDQMKGSLEEQIFLAYECDEEDSWRFERVACHWDERPEHIDRIELRFISHSRPYGCDTMQIAVRDVGKRSGLTHPLTGETYALFVDKAEQQELPADVLKSVRQLQSRHLEYPSHYLAVSYHTEPALSREDFCLQSVGEGDEPRGLSRGHAAGISMIGGADGPTSIFLAGKVDPREDRTVMSGLHFQPVDSGLFQPFFMVKEREDMTLTVAL